MGTLFLGIVLRSGKYPSPLVLLQLSQADFGSLWAERNFFYDASQEEGRRRKNPFFPLPHFPPQKKRKSVPIHSMQISALPPLSVWRKSTIINWDNRRRPTKGGSPPPPKNWISLPSFFPYSFLQKSYKKKRLSLFCGKTAAVKAKRNFVSAFSSQNWTKRTKRYGSSFSQGRAKWETWIISQ